jgi:hypothetical protein
MKHIIKSLFAAFVICTACSPVKKEIISYVDTSLDGSQKYVLRVDGRPFYMTNIQVRLDKLKGYCEPYFDEAAREAVIKRCADDGFNTVSIPVHWREVEPEKDRFDWTTLDEYLGLCKKYGLKMELLWFSWSSGGRVQYLFDNALGRQLRTPDYVCSIDGTSEFNMLRKEWEYTLDWRDTALRERETYVLGRIMEHVTEWDAGNGNPHTVIGVQLGNEARSHGDNRATAEEIVDYYHAAGAAVKQSNYVVWTRLNCVFNETPGRILANEARRNAGGTNIDFVGIDIYRTNASVIKGDNGGQMPPAGKNYRMIMECGAEDSLSAVYQMAALAGDKAYDYYDMASTDGHALYDRDGTTLVPHGDYVADVRAVNKIMNEANEDIALNAHGKGLYVYNCAGNSTVAEKGIEGIVFTPSIPESQAIAIRRSPTEIVLLATHEGAFDLPVSLNVKSASKGFFDKNNDWVNEGDVAWNGTSVAMPAASVVRLALCQ